MHRFLGFWQCLLPELPSSAWTVLQILAAQFLARTAAVADVLAARTGRFWSVFAGQNCPILLLFWQQNWVVLAELGWKLALVRPVFVII